MNEFLEKPNLPTGRVTKVITDYRISKTAEKSLEKQGIEVIKSFPHKNLYNAVNGHPDMQIHHLGKNKFVCEPSVYEYYKQKLMNSEIIKGIMSITDKYPFDIAYNAVVIGNCFFHNLNFTDSKIYEYYKSLGVKLLNVRQGYTKCSVAVISENAIITSDISISKIAAQNNIDTLYFDPSDIKLSGVSNGFAGGICGLINRNLLAVNGDINLLNNGKEFVAFCNKYGVDLLNLNDNIPEDIGSIIPVEQNTVDTYN